MLKWKEFLEAKDAAIEKAEEETGLDLDGDNEEGESAEHRAKVNKDPFVGQVKDFCHRAKKSKKSKKD